MAAQVHLKTKFQFITNQPGAILRNGDQLDTVRRPILLLTGHLARFAAPAQVMVYFYFELGHTVCLLLINEHRGAKLKFGSIRNGFYFK